MLTILLAFPAATAVHILNIYTREKYRRRFELAGIKRCIDKPNKINLDASTYDPVLTHFSPPSAPSIRTEHIYLYKETGPRHRECLGTFTSSCYAAA